jgi:hypothetical protein
MNLILHIVRKDFLFLRTRLAVWGAVMAAKIALGFWFVLWGDIPGRALFSIQGGVAGLIIFDAALTLLLAALLVQEDGVAGTAAFWRTRPISGLRLFAAKLTGAFLLLVVPAVLVAVPWWVLCGFGPAQVALAALEVVLFQVALLFVAFTAASVTNSIARCLVWGILGGLVVVYLGGWWGSVLAKSAGGVGGPELAFIIIFIMLPLGAVVVVWQYLTRRVAGGVTMLMAGGVLAPLAAYGLFILLADKGPQTERLPWKENSALTRDIALEWKSARAAERSIGAKKVANLEFGFEMKGVPAGHVVAGWLAKYDVRGSDVGLIPLLRSGVWGDYFPRAIPAVLENASQPGGLAAMRTVEVWSTCSLQPEIMANVRQGTVSLQGTLSFQLARPTMALELPLAPSPWRAGNGRGARMIRVEQTDRGLLAHVLETSPLAALQEIRRALGGPKLPGAGSSYYALVRWPGQATALARQDQPYAMPVLGGVQLRRGTLEIGGAAGKASSDLAAAKLQLVDLTDWTHFHRDVKIEGVKVE